MIQQRAMDMFWLTLPIALAAFIYINPEGFICSLISPHSFLQGPVMINLKGLVNHVRFGAYSVIRERNRVKNFSGPVSFGRAGRNRYNTY